MSPANIIILQKSQIKIISYTFGVIHHKITATIINNSIVLVIMS